MFKFGVDIFIWSENFTKKDIWFIEKSKSLGFEVLDIFISNPDNFPTKLVAKEVKK